MDGAPVERPFEDDTSIRQVPKGARASRRNLPDSGAAATERRTEARRRGLHPAPASEGRSRNMQAIRRVDTKPEIALRSALHRLGYRFRKDFRVRASDIWVRPDIVFTRCRVAIFVDGCFWHSCPDHGRSPSRNTSYWSPKLTRNHERDSEQTAALRRDGWVVLRYWEHQETTYVVNEIAAEVDATPGAKVRC